jgi:mRNA-degrading endonuclease toxin of MazEF toxin-antitoxin module
VSHEPGQVFRLPAKPDSLVVVLSSTAANRASGWVTVCMYGLTGMVGNLSKSDQLHSLTPSPGFITWTIHQSVPSNTLQDPIGTVETAALATARFAMEARFS